MKEVIALDRNWINGRKRMLRNKIGKVIQFIINPHLLLCFGIAWLITNGWSYVLLSIGMYCGIRWMIAVASGYLAFLWLPISPEKIVTIAIAMLLLRCIFPNDQKTLGMLKNIRSKFRNKSRIDKEFYHLIKDVVSSDEYMGMKNNKHHIKSNVYHHSIKVAYLCYKHHKKFGTKINLQEFVRGALLHDYYLYDWHDRKLEHKFHGFMHPKRALKNALEKYPDLTENEKDMIVRHMFPLTVIPPKTKAGWIICFYDKVAAISDYFGKNRWKTEKEKLVKI